MNETTVIVKSYLISKGNNLNSCSSLNHKCNRKPCTAPCGRKGESSMPCTEAYKERHITVCDQTVILTNVELAAALLSLPEKNREIIFLYFFGHYTQREIGEMYRRCRSTTGYQIRRTLQLLHKEMEVLSHGNPNLFPMKRLSGRLAGSRKPWTRFYCITASDSESPP